MDFPAGILVPDEAGAMTAAGDDVQLAIAVDVGWQDVGGAGMFAGQEVFLERPGGILAGLPPGEPLALAGLVRGTALGRKGDVEPSVAVKVACTKVMTQTGRIVFRKHMACPALGQAGIFRHLQPDGGVWEFALRLGAVGEEIELAVSVHVRLEHAVDANDFVLGDACLPRAGSRVFVRLLKPNDEAGLIAGTDEIRIAIAVHVEGFAVNEVVILVIADDDLLPVRRDEQPRFVAGVADDIHLAVAGEIGSHRHVVVQPLPDDVTFPVALHLGLNAGQKRA